MGTKFSELANNSVENTFLNFLLASVMNRMVYLFSIPVFQFLKRFHFIACLLLTKGISLLVFKFTITE